MAIRDDCGNSPRMAIVVDLVSAWAADQEHVVREWLRKDVEWTLVGDATATTGGYVPPPISTERGEILTVLSHGRVAACDGYLQQGGERVDFCHVIRFAGCHQDGADPRDPHLPAACRPQRVRQRRPTSVPGHGASGVGRGTAAPQRGRSIRDQYPMDFRYSRDSRMQSIGSRP